MTKRILILAAGLIGLAPGFAHATTVTFCSSGCDYTATTQSWTVPAGVSTVTVKAWGGGGGGGAGCSDHDTSGCYGAGAGFAKADVTVSAGNILTVKFGGGGTGGPANGSDEGDGGGGGGFSAVFSGDCGAGCAAADLMVVAGGGGGGGGADNSGSRCGNGGPGGGSSGTAGQNGHDDGGAEAGGGGGTQAAGGAGGSGQTESDSGDGTGGTSLQGGLGGRAGGGAAGGGGAGGTNGGGAGGNAPAPGAGGGGGAGRYGGGGGEAGTDNDFDGGAGGGGGSACYTTDGGASCVAANGTTIVYTAGSGQNAGNNADTNYASNAGRGGAGGSYGAGTNGNPGRVVLIYTAAAGITISGTCDAYDQTTDCTDAGGADSVKVAVDGSVQGTSDTTVDGSWSIADVTTPSAGAVITVWVDGVGDSDEAVAVTQYDGTGNITGIKLFKEHLTIGSDDNQSLTITEIDAYDQSGDEDVFFEANTSSFTCDGVASTTGLCVDGTAQSTQDRLYILASNTLAPGGNVRTSRLDVRGTYTGAAGETLTLNGSGANTTCGNASQMPLCVNGGTFTVPATVVFNGAADSNIHTATYTALELKPGADNVTFTSNSGNLNVTGALTVGNGTNTGTVNLDTNDPTVDVDGDITIAANGTLVASASGAFTAGGSWTNNGAFTDSGGTMSFNSTAAGKTMNGQMTGAGDNFGTLTFNGVGGQWTLAADLEVATMLNITNGTMNQGATFGLTSNAVTVASGGVWTNTGTGDVTFTGTGDISNAGAITLDGSGAGCGGADAITLSGGGVARDWSGAGSFTLADLTVNDTEATSQTALSSTAGSNNMWAIEDDCDAGGVCL